VRDGGESVLADLAIQAMQILTQAAGSLGMVSGQAIDCASIGKPLSRTHTGVYRVNAK